MRLAPGAGASAVSRAKDRILQVLKATGVFAVCRRLTRRQARILCYHGVALADEHAFQPLLFMRPATFRKQLNTLKALGYPVVSLEHVAALLDGASLPPCAVVLTIDDGWYGTYQHALPALIEHGYPATVYVTTYYVEQQLPVFNVLVSYLFWRSELAVLDVAALGYGLIGNFDLRDPAARALAVRLVQSKDAELGPQARHALSRALGAALGQDVEALTAQRLLSLMTPAELQDAASMPDIDIQLHTHRHRMGAMTRAEIEREITDNRASLARLLGREFTHFCYPSGNCDRVVWPFLQDLGVRTATTTVAGLTARGSDRFGLRRICISDQISDIEFEAELSGAAELLRTLKRWGTRTRGPAA